MCRIIAVKSESEFECGHYLREFADACKNSKEYQGHGWGCSYLSGGEWKHYKNISPIWEDDLSQFSVNSNLLIAHARSAFRNEGIAVENNMPFHDEGYVFVFNGELRGVKLNSPGRIGAEKIFNFVNRLNKNDIGTAIMRATDIIRSRSSYIRAINFIISDKLNLYVYSSFSEDPNYFTVRYSTNGKTVICSEALPLMSEVKEIPNHTLMKF